MYDVLVRHDKAFFDGASEERLPNGGRHEAKIRGPEGIPEEAYDAMVLEAFDDYEHVDDMYHALDGPNSNTAVDDMIESTGGSIPTIEPGVHLHPCTRTHHGGRLSCFSSDTHFS